MPVPIFLINDCNYLGFKRIFMSKKKTKLGINVEFRYRVFLSEKLFGEAKELIMQKGTNGLKGFLRAVALGGVTAIR